MNNLVHNKHRTMNRRDEMSRNERRPTVRQERRGLARFRRLSRRPINSKSYWIFKDLWSKCSGFADVMKTEGN